jgi:hypothetical protein
MTLEDLGNIGEFVAAVGVIVSLIYLAIQIRRNTGSVRAATFQNVSKAWQDWMYSLSEGDTFPLFYRGCFDPTSLNDMEGVQYWLLVRALFRGYENDHYQYNQGAFDAKAWEGYRESLRNDILSIPGIRAVWMLDRQNYNKAFAEYVDQELKSARIRESFGIAEGLAGLLRSQKPAV